MDRNLRKVKQGVVASDKMDKTITVVVENRKRHPMYNKIMTTTKKLKAHDENNEAGEGALVEIMENATVDEEGNPCPAFLVTFKTDPNKKEYYQMKNIK